MFTTINGVHINLEAASKMSQDEVAKADFFGHLPVADKKDATNELNSELAKYKKADEAPVPDETQAE